MKKIGEGSGMGDKDGNLGTSTFTSLVLSLSSTAWIALGKIADPVTGKINTDLNGAKFSIDTLIMLRDKTKGNLSMDEQKLLDGVIADLQANYAETIFSTKEESKTENREVDKNKIKAQENDNKKNEEEKLKTKSKKTEDNSKKTEDKTE